MPTKSRPDTRRSWKRWLAGAAWLLVWAAILWTFAAPWRKLGGLVDERLRWLEYAALFSALSVGLTIGGAGREAAESGRGRTHAGFLRRALYPVGVSTAATLVAFQCLDWRDGAGIVASAFLAYWAGLDLAFGAFPLMAGRCYRFDRPLDPPRLDAWREERRATWVPPWERF